MELNYSDTAIDDLYELLDFISLDSQSRAFTYVEKLKLKIELLAIFPNMGVSCQSKGIDEDCRVMIYESYLIFYTVEYEKVVIRNIINSAVDYTQNEIPGT